MKNRCQVIGKYRKRCKNKAWSHRGIVYSKYCFKHVAQGEAMIKSRCKGFTKAGKRCRASSWQTSEYCWSHAPATKIERKTAIERQKRSRELSDY